MSHLVTVSLVASCMSWLKGAWLMAMQLAPISELAPSDAGVKD